MEQVQVMKVTFRGKENLQEFAMGILFLTNLKSSVKESVVNITTMEGTDLVDVVVYLEFFKNNKSLLVHHMGEVIDEELQVLYSLDGNDIKPSVVKVFNEAYFKSLDDEFEAEPVWYLDSKEV